VFSSLDARGSQICAAMSLPEFPFYGGDKIAPAVAQEIR
jgi:hypothetical protein